MSAFDGDGPASSTDHGSVLSPRSSALVVSEDGELSMRMAHFPDDAEVPRMVLLLAAVLVRSRDDEWVEDMLSDFQSDLE